MTASSETRPTVLVVDDEQDLVDLFSTWLAEEYTVRTAYGGEEALDQYDAEVDVALLDRRMPDLSGDEVLSAIRDRAGDCQVIMVTAVDPDFDILEMGFDGYVTKPVEREALHTAIDRVRTRSEYDEQVQTYYGLVAKRGALEAKKSEGELAESDAFAALNQRISELESEVEMAVEEFGEADFEAAFRELNDF